MTFRILYLSSYSFWRRKDCILSVFYRISNYLNSRKDDLDEEIEEEYVDLEYEDLPEFSIENIEVYREEVKKLIEKIKRDFNFDLALISCYSSFSYINCIEISAIIKYDIDPSCIITVGGIHPTIRPEDFNPKNFPKYFFQKYPKNYNPIDNIICEEGELPFFNLIRDICNGTNKKRKDTSEKSLFLPPKTIDNLNDIPLIDLSLYKKYENELKDIKNLRLWIDFSRGCPFKCDFCLNSEDYFSCYKKVRLKSIQKCIEELKIIKNIDWISIKSVNFTDLIFLPKRSFKNQFFNEMNELIDREGEFPFDFYAMDRIDLCSLEDLENYQKLKIVVDFGVETFSKTLLTKINKILGKDKNQIKKAVDNYLKKTEAIIKKADEIGCSINLNFLFCMPGTTKEILEEERSFFMEKRYDGKSLAEKYRFTLGLNVFMAYYGTKIYDDAEKIGATIYFKEWWKKFHHNQLFYASLVDPSEDLTFLDSYSYYTNLIKQILIKQNELGNPNYDKFSLSKILFAFQNNYKIYERIASNLDYKNKN
ncbi:MAG: hypothetical protein EU541_05035 [Promethearchaeota archaeon]|nr:MAG: hypothetical protein EU541_05035 [Candidatus Lokiarchaeota archaeon]